MRLSNRVADLNQKAFLVMLALMLVALAGCSYKADQSPPNPPQADSAKPSSTRLRLVTTTSLYDTGLWDELESRFEHKYGIQLDVISGGTGKALQYGRNGDVDVLTIHDRAREEQFIADGFGTMRNVVAYNYFLIIGPRDDPAGLKGMNPQDALARLMVAGKASRDNVSFVSRGDDSGTHSREKSIWTLGAFDYNEVRKSGVWYIEAGTGMGATLTLANEKSAYTLTDIGTYLAFQGDLDLMPIVESGDALLNVYSAIPINPGKLDGINRTDTDKLVEFLMSEEIQDVIGQYGISEYGRPLFIAAGGIDPGD